jgi:hypothetical protein
MILHDEPGHCSVALLPERAKESGLNGSKGAESNVARRRDATCKVENFDLRNVVAQGACIESGAVKFSDRLDPKK